MKHYSNGPSPIKQDTLAMSLTELKRIADVSNNEQLHVNHLLPCVDGYCLKISAKLFSKCSMIRGHHICKERLTRVSQRHSQGAQDQPSRPRRVTSRLWGKFKRKVSHSTPAQSSVVFIPNEGAMLLGQKRLRRQKRNEVSKQPQNIQKEDSKRSQASSSRFTVKNSTRGSEQLPENTPITEVTQSSVSSNQISTQSSYESAKSQLAA